MDTFRPCKSGRPGRRHRPLSPGASLATARVPTSSPGPMSPSERMDRPVSRSMPTGTCTWSTGATRGSRSSRRAAEGTPGVTLAGGNGRGPGANQLDEPWGVAVDSEHNVYVADRWNHRVQKWAPGATAGVTVAGGNGPGSGPDQLNNPMGIVIDSRGDIYVADMANNRVQLWVPGAEVGVPVAGGEGEVRVPTSCTSPPGSPCGSHPPPIRHRPRPPSTSPTRRTPGYRRGWSADGPPANWGRSRVVSYVC